MIEGAVFSGTEGDVCVHCGRDCSPGKPGWINRYPTGNDEAPFPHGEWTCGYCAAEFEAEYCECGHFPDQHDESGCLSCKEDFDANPEFYEGEEPCKETHSAGHDCEACLRGRDEWPPAA